MQQADRQRHVIAGRLELDRQRVGALEPDRGASRAGQPLLRLDDEEFWRTETECNHLFWFAPAVGNTVHEEKEAQYFDKGDPLSRATFRTQHAVVELTSFRRA